MPFEITPVVTVIGGVIAACATYLFTKWREREAEWRKDKMQVYKEFALSVGEYCEGASEGRMRFVSACNGLNLVAPQPVIEALKKVNSENNTKDGPFETRISRVFYEMRRDLKISPKDDAESFGVRIWQLPKGHKPNG